MKIIGLSYDLGMTFVYTEILTRLDTHWSLKNLGIDHDYGEKCTVKDTLCICHHILFVTIT